MRIFVDFHHGGAARGQILTLQCRLGHELYFPSSEFAEHYPPGMWLGMMPGWDKGQGGLPEGTVIRTIDHDEFFEMEWDAVMATRIESVEPMKALLAGHPKSGHIKHIAMTGNDATVFDWDWAKNFLCSDYLSYLRAPKTINKIWYSQEIGTQFGDVYVPITPRSLKNINQYVNCWPTFTGAWMPDRERSGWGGLCPHCDEPPTTVGHMVLPKGPYQIWLDAQALLPDYRFNEYGMGCKLGCAPETQLPDAYASGALTFHMKTYDGYGYSMLQSIACGRPVIVPRRFHRYRTANKYLIPNLTCFEAEWTGESVAEVVRDITSSVEKANSFGSACYQAGKALFNWELEASRVGEFMGRLI